MLQNFESLKKDFRNFNHGWDFIMDGQKNTHLDFQCVADELSLEHTPVSVLLMNCLQSKIPFSVLLMNCLQSKIPFSALRMNCLQSKIPFSVLLMNCLQSKIPFSALLTNCYRRFPAKQSTILTAEYNPCSPQLIDPPSINHSTGVTGMRQPVRRVTFRALSAIEVWPFRVNKLSMTLWAHLATEIWPCGPNKSQKYDLVGPVSYRSVTLWAQSATEVSLSGPSQLQKYDLQGPPGCKSITFMWPSGPNQLYMYDL